MTKQKRRINPAKALIAGILFAATLTLLAIFIQTRKSPPAQISKLPGQPAVQVSSIESIAYIGCSNSGQSVSGYHKNPGNKGKFWQPYQTGGKSVDAWANVNHKAWELFDDEIRRNGQPDAVWVQLCEDERKPVTYEDVKKIFEILADRVDTQKFFISSVNSFEPYDMCRRLGEDANADTVAFADKIAFEGIAERGPELGPLTTKTAKDDGCHPNESGELYLGKQLLDFFD